MKKSKFNKILASCAMGIIALAMPFALTGCDKDSDINVRVEGEYVQWQVEGEDSWTNLLTIDEIKDLLGNSYKGDTGAKGEQGNPGINGREVEFNKTSTHIVWRYVGENTWKDLIGLEELKGEPGADLTIKQVTVTFNYTLHKYFSDYEQDVMQSFRDKYTNGITYNSEIINKGDWIDLYDFSNTPLGDYFLGWYAGSGINETKITSYTSISENITLTAKFDIEKIETEYYTEGLIFRLTQNEEILLSDTNSKYYNYTSGENVYVVDGFDGYFNSSLGDNASRKNLIFPRKYKGVNVVGISSNFANNFTAKYYANSTEKTCGILSVCMGDIYLPNSLEYIGANAFRNLTDSSTSGDYSLYIPNSVRVIGYDAFYGSDYTLSISNELSLVAIGDSAFNFSRGRFNNEDESTTYLTIDSNVTYVGAYAFANIDSLVNIMVDINENEIDTAIFQENWYNADNENICVNYKTS